MWSMTSYLGDYLGLVLPCGSRWVAARFSQPWRFSARMAQGSNQLSNQELLLHHSNFPANAIRNVALSIREIVESLTLSLAWNEEIYTWWGVGEEKTDYFFYKLEQSSNKAKQRDKALSQIITKFKYWWFISYESECPPRGLISLQL